MMRTLIDILQRERQDLGQRIAAEERAPIHNSERLANLRKEAQNLDRQLERLMAR